MKKAFPAISQGLIAYDKYQGQTDEIIKSRAFHYLSFEKPYLKKWLWGEDITPFLVKWNEKEWVDYSDKIANPREQRYFTGERILIREITNPKIYCSFTDEELYFDPSVIVILENETKGICSIKFLNGLLNSTLATFYHFNASPKATKGAFPKILVEDIKKFPIAVPSKEVETQIETLVNQILINKKEGKDTVVLESEIDRLVYALYELTEAEIAVVEGK